METFIGTLVVIGIVILLAGYAAIIRLIYLAWEELHGRGR